ncbi:hypothetical protein OA107_00115 [Candidatus Pelagibacter sp.]|nr:hypothetical protein [Candidatus Pelagibacter sp.]
MRKIFILTIIFLSSCGYQPIYLNKSIKTLEFSKISFTGDNLVNRKIINSLNIKENKSMTSDKELKLTSLFTTEETSKDSRGQVVSYRSSINVNWEVMENNESIENRSFYQDFTYNNRDNKFELVEYQNEVKNNISEKVIEEIILYISLK